MKKLAVLATYLLLTGFSFSPSAKDIFKDNEDIKSCDTRQMNKSICYEYVIRKHLTIGDGKDYFLGRAGESVQASLNKTLGTYNVGPTVSSELKQQSQIISKFNSVIVEIRKIPANSNEFREAVADTGAFRIVDELNTQTEKNEKLLSRIQFSKERLKQYQAKAEALKERYKGMDEVFDKAVVSVLTGIGRDIDQLETLEQSLAEAKGEIEQVAAVWRKVGEVYKGADARELEKLKNYASSHGMAGFEQGLANIAANVETAKKFQNYLVFVEPDSTYSWLYDDIYFDKNLPKAASFTSKQFPAILRVDFNQPEGVGNRRRIQGQYLKLVKVEEFKTALGDSGFMVYFEDLELNYRPLSSL